MSHDLGICCSPASCLLAGLVTHVMFMSVNLLFLNAFLEPLTPSCSVAVSLNRIYCEWTPLDANDTIAR